MAGAASRGRQVLTAEIRPYRYVARAAARINSER